MKSFAICLACLAALVPLEARKFDSAGAYRKALSMTRKPTEEQTVDEILADVPSEAEETVDSAYKEFDPMAAFKEDLSVGTDVPVAAFQGPSIPQDVAIQPAAGLSVQQETGATLHASLESPMSTPEEPKLPELPTNLEAIEQTVLHLAEKAKTKNSSVDPAMVAMIQSINQILENTIVTDLIKQYNDACDTVFEAIARIRQCINGTNSSYNPQITPDAYNLSEYDNQHFQCRQEQIQENTIGGNMGGSCDAYKDRCVMLNNTWNADGTGNIVDWQTCLVQPGRYGGSMWLGDYYQDQHAFWVALWGQLNASHARVVEACTLWQDCEANRSQYTGNMNALKTRCNERQAFMDDASCEYKRAVDTEWAIYWDCCSTAYTQCPPVIEKARFDIRFLDAQYIATERIQCYMSSFAIADTTRLEEELHHCRTKNYTVMHAPGVRRYPPRPYETWYPFPPCPPCPPVPHECGDRMNQSYVTGVDVTASNPRYPNMSDIAGTPAYETLHYRPHEAKLLVAECGAPCCPNRCR